MKIITDNLTPLKLGRLNKALNVKYKFKEGVFTLKEYIFKYGKGKKISSVLKRTGNIVQEYSLISKRETFISIPKIVYECLHFENEIAHINKK